MKKDLKKVENELFEEIQNLVLELPWDHKTNLRYFTTCVHEAGHALFHILYQNHSNIKNFEVVASNLRGKDNNHCLLNFKSAERYNSFYRILCSFSGSILADNFFHYYYGEKKCILEKDLSDIRGGAGDIAVVYNLLGVIDFWITKTTIAKIWLRVMYKDKYVRIIHLGLIRDLLKHNGKLEYKDLKKYLTVE